jgi:hypothetical protein
VNSERVFGAIDRERVPIPRLLYAALEYVWFENRDWGLGIGNWGLGIGDGIGKETFYATLVRFKRMELSLKIGSW